MRLNSSIRIARNGVKASRRHRSVARRTLMGTAAVLAFGCRPTPQETNPAASGSVKGVIAAESLKDSMRAPPPLGATTVAALKGGPQRPRAQAEESSSVTIPSEARKPKRPLEKDISKPDRTDTLSVSAFLDGPVGAGRIVSIRGKCRDQFHASGSAGAPPRSRSDWQLADDRAAVYVSGPMPAGCASGSVVVSGLVVVDTIQVSGRSVSRRFIVIENVPR